MGGWPGGRSDGRADGRMNGWWKKCKSGKSILKNVFAVMLMQKHLNDCYCDYCEHGSGKVAF